MKNIFIVVSLVGMFACNQPMKEKTLHVLPYPQTDRGTHTDDYFGNVIADPYRWLEFDTAVNVEAWVDAQNVVTNHYIGQIPFKESFRARLTEIWNYPKYGSPFIEGDWYYFFKNDGLQNQSVLYRQRGLGGDAEVFLDPNTLSEDGTVSLASLSFSKDNKYCAIGIARSGSDWNEIYVIETETQNRLDDDIKWVKFSSAMWHKNGFYYSRYDEPVKGKEYSTANQFMKIYYHSLGQPQSKDVLIYEDKENPLRYFNAELMEDERYLIINVSEGTSGSQILYKDLSANKPDFELLFKGFTNNYDVIYSTGERLLVRTDYEAPRYRLVSVDPKNPSPENWEEVLPQANDLLQSASTCGGKLFASYLKDASSRMYAYDIDGSNKTEIALPGIGTASSIGGKARHTEAFYSFSSFTNPGEIYRYDITTGTSTLFKKTEVAFDVDAYQTQQVFYPSKDGTNVPMFIISKKGIKKDGKNPTMLYGYGGFNISLTPSFSLSRMLFLEQGGVYVIANLRGGGEYGEDWHKAGMLDKKQNVFDDFIAAAEYLIAEKYTSSAHLAINGGSNGGLLVGACMTQRPELFAAAIPAVGVLDMMRYHTFTIGWGWAVEYGRSDVQEQFEYLIKYSPLHNVKSGINYPATLIMTADHDDRVVPAHSFKFAAELQHHQIKNGNPILIRIDKKAGHGAGKPTAKLIDDATDFWSFVLWHTHANKQN
jgi:prolyl oligopeptidase